MFYMWMVQNKVDEVHKLHSISYMHMTVSKLKNTKSIHSNWGIDGTVQTV